MAVKEYATIFHNRAQFRKNFLEQIGWSEADLSDFRANLEQESFKPEALYPDLFVNGFTGIPDADQVYPRVTWWRELAPKLSREQWFLAAVGYASVLAMREPQEVLLVDFWERELDSENLPEALRVARESFTGKKSPLQWICWSHTLLENWQQEGLGDTAEREERLAAYFRSLGLDPIFVPVTDPLGALVAARQLAIPSGTGAKTRVIVMPSFGNDKLVHANWYMKTVARYAAALEGREQ